MKPIDEMAIEEIRKEIYEFETEKFNKNRNYIFISYSHKDKDVVYPKVLEWIRQGYNVYIDVDFENHGSDEHWVDIMYDRVTDNACVLAVCFRSENYYFSYASLIELLSMRSRETLEFREVAIDPALPIEIVVIGHGLVNDGKEFSEEARALHEPAFEKWQKECGGSFLRDNPSEKQKLKEGLATLYTMNAVDENGKKLGESRREELAEEKAEKEMEKLERGFAKGFRNYYPLIAWHMSQFFVENKLTGNYKNLEADGIKKQFEEKRVHHFEQTEKAVQGGPGASETVSATHEEAPQIRRETPTRDEGGRAGKQYLSQYGCLRQLEDGGFLLLKGALISKKAVGSCPEAARKKREESLEKGEWADKGERYELLTDKWFKSMSGAAGYVAGFSVNGKTFWKEEAPGMSDGKSGEIQKPEAVKTAEEPGKAMKVDPETTLGQFETLLLDPENCRSLRILRSEHREDYSKQIFDYVMAAVLRGCDEKAEAGSPKWNYCSYVVAKEIDEENAVLGASQFTWQSNSRKAVGIEGSGKLGENSGYFAALPSSMTLKELRDCFSQGSHKAFQTRNNQGAGKVFGHLFGLL